MATLAQLADELERSHAELQERMSDPAVYTDHREAADLGRRLKELEPAVRAAREWRQASADLAEAKDDPSSRPWPASSRPRCAARGRAQARARRARSRRREGRDRRGPAGRRRRRGGALGRRGRAHAPALRRAPRLQDEVLSANENEGGGVKETVFAVKGDGAFSVSSGRAVPIASSVSRRPSRRAGSTRRRRRSP